jgi:predicted O-methyltransferase YrrM
VIDIPGRASPALADDLDRHTIVPYEIDAYAQSRIRRRVFSCAGTFVGWRRLPNALRALSSTLRRKLIGSYPDEPFIPYCAAAELPTLLSRDMNVVEVGAGMSTPWLAARVGHVTSYDWNEVWFAFMQSELQRRGIHNVDLRLCTGNEPSLFADVRENAIDFALIDSGIRSKCLFELWPKVRPGGLLYLDNWDSDLFWLEDGYNARAFLRQHRSEIATTRLFVDYVPGYVSVSEGLLVVKR